LGDAWKIESATFSGKHSLLTTPRRPSFQRSKPQSMIIENRRHPAGVFPDSGATI
jgi:hypothetical protein